MSIDTSKPINELSSRELLEAMRLEPKKTEERPEGFFVALSETKDQLSRAWSQMGHGSLQAGTPLMAIFDVFAEQLTIIKLTPFKDLDMGTFGPLIKESVNDFVKTERFLKSIEATVEKAIESVVEQKMKEYFAKSHEREKELAKAFDLKDL